jgi:hypothetical protein
MTVAAMTNASREGPTGPTHAEAGRMARAHQTQGRTDRSDLSDQKLGVRRIDLHAALTAMRAVFRPEDARERWRYEFHERAGLLEFDCGLSRVAAERQALTEMMKRNESVSAEIMDALTSSWPRDFDARQETLAFEEIFKLER